MTTKQALDYLINTVHLEDYAYSVRENAIRPPDWVGSSWDLPEVKKFSEAIEAIKKELNTPEPLKFGSME